MKSVTSLPLAFQERFQSLLGKEYSLFLESLKQPPVHFVRVNTTKIDLEQGVQRLKHLGINPAPLPWFPAGFRVSGKSDILPFTKEYSLGYYYIQEGASMLPPVILNPNTNHTILDLCAAPGSKTTQLAQMMKNQGTIIANDRSFRRITSLGHNIQLCGIINTIVLCEDGRHLSTRVSIKFDRVLVDAPCTASGHLRSKPPQFDAPDSQRLLGIQALQKSLITSGFRFLKPGGLMVYSTCSLHPEENEAIIHHLLTHVKDVSIIPPQIPNLNYHRGLTEWNDSEYHTVIQNCLRIYPHENDTDGFFIALIRKEP